MNAPEPKWYIPGSVVSALWGSVMPRLAATVWKGDLQWPPASATAELVHDDMYAYPVTGEALEEFWEKLATIAFESKTKYNKLRDDLKTPTGPGKARFSRGQRAAHAVLDYYDPHPGSGSQDERRLPVRIIRADAYDFVLSSYGMDIFIPKNPFEDDDGDRDDETGRKTVLQMYKFRKTGIPPIGLPKLPASSMSDGDDHLIPLPQLSGPTGAYQIHENWARGRAGDVAWWLSGSAFRGIMAELPRIIAYKWYEEVAWPGEEYDTDPLTVRSKFMDDLRELLEERMETRLPEKMEIAVVEGQPDWAHALKGWNPRDLMFTDNGVYVPDPGEAPEADELLSAIEAGTAGNPVFTDTGGGDE